MTTNTWLKFDERKKISILNWIHGRSYSSALFRGHFSASRCGIASKTLLFVIAVVSYLLSCNLKDPPLIVSHLFRQLKWNL